MGEFRRLCAVRMVRDLEDNPDVEIVPQSLGRLSRLHIRSVEGTATSGTARGGGLVTGGQ